MSNDSGIFIILNMGVEMVYILNSRLEGQKIEEKKAIVVLRDICSSLLNN